MQIVTVRSGKSQHEPLLQWAERPRDRSPLWLASITVAVVLVCLLLRWPPGAAHHAGPRGAAAPEQPYKGASEARMYMALPGDTLSSVAVRFGVSVTLLADANGLSAQSGLRAGQALLVPPVSTVASTAATWPAVTRQLLVRAARRFGLDPALVLAVAWEESRFQQSARSAAGAVGIMQVTPQALAAVEQTLGHPVDISVPDGNVTAGVAWLAQLVRYYQGDERTALAAYYEGQGNLASRGLFADTQQYVNQIMVLRAALADSSGS